jgi:glycosyltransferase involved in cell wall biosynthesis
LKWPPITSFSHWDKVSISGNTRCVDMGDPSPSNSVRIGSIVFNEHPPDMRVLVEAMTLRDMGHNVEIIALNHKGSLTVSTENGFKVHRIPCKSRFLMKSPYSPLFHLFTVPRVRKYVEKQGFDKLHVHDLDGLAVGTACYGRKKTPFIFDSHEADYASLARGALSELPKFYTNMVTRFIERRGCRLAEAVVVNSDYAMAAKPPCKKLVSVPYRPPPAMFFSDPEGTPKDHQAIYIGSLSKSKGLILLVECWSELVKRGVRLPLLIVGTIFGKQPIEPMIERKNLGDLIKIVGQIPYRDVPTQLRKCTIGLSPIDPSIRAYQYAFPNKVMDYLACGVGVVSSALPAMEELPDGPVRIFAKYDAHSMADAVQEMASHLPIEISKSAAILSATILPWSDVKNGLASIYADQHSSEDAMAVE